MSCLVPLGAAVSRVSCVLRRVPVNQSVRRKRACAGSQTGRTFARMLAAFGTASLLGETAAAISRCVEEGENWARGAQQNRLPIDTLL